MIEEIINSMIPEGYTSHTSYLLSKLDPKQVVSLKYHSTHINIFGFISMCDILEDHWD